MPLIYKKGNLFDDKEATIFCQACNCQNNWGAGIAKQFKERFPEAFEKERKEYHWILPGSTRFYHVSESDVVVLCLYTSNRYGSRRDPVEQILDNTRMALVGLCEEDCLVDCPEENIIASPKINSGLFGVPWERTEELIKAFVTLMGVTWHVWELED